MKYTVGVAMNPLDQLAGIAKTAEECGFSSIALPDSLFFMETQAADYPYTPDGLGCGMPRPPGSIRSSPRLQWAR